MTKRKYHPFYIFFIFLLSIFQIDAAYASPISAKFIGNEAFQITDGDFILLTDFPYQSGVYGYMEYDFNFSATLEAGKAGKVLALITHRHPDHFDPLLFTEQNWKIIGPEEVTVQLERNKVIKLGETIAYGPLKVIPKRSQHANTEHFSYLVEWHGKKLYFTGDTEALSTLKGLPELDALFITPWFHRKAKMNGMLPEAKKIIIYHHLANDIIPGCVTCIIPIQDEITFIE